MQEQVFKISLAAARVNAKMNQDEAAKALKVSKATLVKWEGGTAEPRITKAREIAELYKVPLENIFFNH